MTSDLKQFEDAIQIILPFFEKYRDEPDIEIEFRLGFWELNENDNSFFNTDVGKEFFDKIKAVLETNEKWSKKEDVLESKTEDFFSGNKRLSINLIDKTRTCITKTTLKKLNFRFENTPFDVRVSFSKEKTISPSKFPKKASFSRIKCRTSYFYKNWVFDLTEVTTEENTIKTITYEVEIELKNIPSKEDATSFYLIHSFLLKVKDLVKMCEPENIDDITSQIILLKI